MKGITPEQIANQMGDFVNTSSGKSEVFNAQMSRQHRTLQQSFTKLCMGWIEHVASDDYEVDGRNVDGKKISQLMLSLLKEHYAKEGFTQETLDLMSKPSGHCPLI